MSVTKIITHEQFVIDGKYRTAVLELEKTAVPIPARTILAKMENNPISVSAAVAAGAGDGGANTGGGTCTIDVSTPSLDGVKNGTYTVEVTKAYVSEGTVAGEFKVTDPLGAVLGTETIGTTWADEIKFKLAESGTKFVVGDAFTIKVERIKHIGRLVAWNPEKTDGSEVPYGILKEDAPADSENTQPVSVYIEGLFNADLALVPDGADVDAAFDGLREKGIILLHQVDKDRNPSG